MRCYDDKNGQKRYATEVVSDRVEFIDKSEQSSGTSQQQGNFGQAGGFDNNGGFGQPVRGGEETIPF